MSNDTKSRIMLWLFLFLLCMFSFFAGIVARADTYMAPKTPTALDVKIDAQQKTSPQHGQAFIEIGGAKLRLGMSKAEVAEKLVGVKIEKLNDDVWVLGKVS
jgi:hypothetical protein